MKTGKFILNQGETEFRTSNLHSLAGTIFWNTKLQKYVMIIEQAWGHPSFLGEIFCSTSPNIQGTWKYATKIISHKEYSFYNPIQHGYVQSQDDRYIFIDGTYSATFSNSPPTPRYDYNNLMYRLDITSAKLAIPQPVYGKKDLKGRVIGENVKKRKKITHDL